jgi:hypothetical protein
MNNVATNYYMGNIDEIIQPDDILYVGNPSIHLDKPSRFQIKAAIQTPPGFMAIGFSLNRVICTLITHYKSSEIFVTGVNFHLGDSLYLNDYMTSIKINNDVDSNKLKSSLFRHDWLFNFLLTRRLKYIFDIKFDSRAEKILEQGVIKSLLSFARRYN